MHIGTLMRLLAAEPRSIVGLFILLSVSLWNDLSDPVFDGVGLAGFKSMANAFLLASLFAHFLSPTGFPFSFFILWVGVVGLRSSDR